MVNGRHLVIKLNGETIGRFQSKGDTPIGAGDQGKVGVSFLPVSYRVTVDDTSRINIGDTLYLECPDGTTWRVDIIDVDHEANVVEFVPGVGA